LTRGPVRRKIVNSMRKTAVFLLSILLFIGCTEYGDYYPNGYGYSHDDPGNGSGGESGPGDFMHGDIRFLGPEDAEIQALAYNEDYLYAGTLTGQVIYISHYDETAQWADLGFVPTAVKSMLVTPYRENLLVAVDQTDPPFIYRKQAGVFDPSDDGIEGGGPVLRMAAEAGGSEIYALTPSSMYASSDDGLTWARRMYAPDLSCADFIDLETHPDLHDTLFVIARCEDQHVLLRTYNGGRFINRFTIPAPNAEEAWTIEVSPIDPDRLVAAGRGAVWTSPDAAKTWELVREFPESDLYFDGGFGWSSGRPIFAGQEAISNKLLLLFGSTGGTTWVRTVVENGYPAKQILCPAMEDWYRCYLATQGGGVLSVSP